VTALVVTVLEEGRVTVVVVPVVPCEVAIGSVVGLTAPLVVLCSLPELDWLAGPVVGTTTDEVVVVTVGKLSVMVVPVVLIVGTPEGVVAMLDDVWLVGMVVVTITEEDVVIVDPWADPL